MQGVVAVMAAGGVDVLCHAAVRARNLGLLLAACRDSALLECVRSLEGAIVSVEAAQVRTGTSTFQTGGRSRT